MMMYYCTVCGAWLKTKTMDEAYRQHDHRGVTGYYHQAKPTGIWGRAPGSDEVGIKPVYGGKRWRAYWIEKHTGYSETPSWGHEAGQTLFFTYPLLRDMDWEPIEAPTEQELIEKLLTQPFLVRQHTPKEIKVEDWQERHPLKEKEAVHGI